MKKILITAFEAFGSYSHNPCTDIANEVDGFTDATNSYFIKHKIVPVSRFRSITEVCETVEKMEPDVLIMLGVAENKCKITPEKLAINHDDFKIPDNDGNQPAEEFIIPSAPLSYFTSLPIKSMVSQIEARGIPAEISYSAGTYVCNHLYFGVLHHIEKQKLDLKTCFVHIPFPREFGLEYNNNPCFSDILDAVLLICDIAVQG